MSMSGSHTLWLLLLVSLTSVLCFVAVFPGNGATSQRKGTLQRNSRGIASFRLPRESAGDAVQEDTQSSEEQVAVADTNCRADMQIAGHNTILKIPAIPDMLFKPMVLREWLLYQTSVEAPHALGRLMEFIPRTHGVFLVENPSDASNEDLMGDTFALRHLEAGELAQRLAAAPSDARRRDRFVFPELTISMENAIAGYKSPCVMDLKLGQRQHGLYADARKIHHQVVKCKASTSGSMGLRHCGMSHMTADGRLSYGKGAARDFTPDQLADAFAAFFHDGVRRRDEVLRALISPAERLAEALRSQRAVTLWSTSVLVAYDAAAPPDSPRCSLSLIDFAHTYMENELKEAGEVPESGPLDPGALLGAESLVRLLRSSLEREVNCIDDPGLQRTQ